VTLKLVVAALGLWLAGAAPLFAQTAYPDKPIKIVNPFPPGSPVDFVGRLVAGKLEATLGQPAVVESRSGAGGTVGANSVAKSAPDGYTLLVTTPSTVATAPALYKALPYDPVKDFAGIWGVNSGGLVVVVNPSLPVKTLAEFIRYARERPGPASDYGREMEEFRALGLAGCKFKVGGLSPPEDLDRTVAARRAVGDDFILCVDANRGWSRADALAFARLARDLNLRWFEEPCFWSNDRKDMAYLRAATGMPIVAGQSEIAAAG
jgi:hypothetical protein